MYRGGLARGETDRLFNMDVVIFRWTMTRKIGTKTVVTICVFYAQNSLCQKCVRGRDSAPDSAGELTALRQIPSWIWEVLRSGEEREGNGRKGEWEGKEGTEP